MRHSKSTKTCALALGAALFGFASGVFADSLLPVIPEAQTRFSDEQGCVEPTQDMRKNHMEYILHQRDDTMYDGIRTSRHSLKECINCHVPEAQNGKVVRHDDPEHFCNSCHTYAAVKIDCFQCHADRPMKDVGFHPMPVTKSGMGMPHHQGGLTSGAISSETLEQLSGDLSLQ